jgi:hypothetical protein
MILEPLSLFDDPVEPLNQTLRDLISIAIRPKLALISFVRCIAVRPKLLISHAQDSHHSVSPFLFLPLCKHTKGEQRTPVTAQAWHTPSNKHAVSLYM